MLYSFISLQLGKRFVSIDSCAGHPLRSGQADRINGREGHLNGEQGPSGEVQTLVILSTNAFC